MLSTFPKPPPTLPTPCPCPALQVWDYIFMGGEEPAGSGIAPELLHTMRREFEYWCARAGGEWRTGMDRCWKLCVLAKWRGWEQASLLDMSRLEGCELTSAATAANRYPFDLRVSGKDLIQVGWQFWAAAAAGGTGQGCSTIIWPGLWRGLSAAH